MNTVISRDGTSIAFDRYGAGPAVILVGGAFQHRAIDPQTADLAKRLAPRFSVYHYDRRGRGDSGDTPPYAIAREIEDIEVLIQHAGGSALVFGMSSGAVLALRAAASGLAIQKLAVYEPPFNAGDDASRQASQGYIRQLSSFLEKGQPGEAAAFAMTTFGSPPEVIAGMRQMPIWSGFEAVAPTLVYDGTIMGDGAVPVQQIASVTLPTLVIDGGASPAFMHTAADALAKALPNAARRTLDGQTHAVDPAVLAPVLEAFFAG